MLPTFSSPVHGMRGVGSRAASSAAGVGLKGFHGGGGLCATAAVTADGDFFAAAASASLAHWPLCCFQSASVREQGAPRSKVEEGRGWGA